MLPLYDYNGSLAGNLLEDTDVINTLNSSETTRPLSAAQGKVLSDKLNTIKFTELIASNANNWTDVSINIDDFDAFLLICTQSNYASMLGSILVPRHSITLNNEISAFYPGETANYEAKMKFTTNSNMQVWTKTEYDGCVAYGLNLSGGE